jgi:hypothetical protein
MKVDPTGLIAVAQRLAAAGSDLVVGEVVHPPLAPDDTSVAAAARLTAAGSALASVAGEQAAALASTAAQLGAAAASFAEQEELNKASVAALRPLGGAATASGEAVAMPLAPPDVRPPLAAVAVLPGELTSRLLSAGNGGAGAGFIAGCSQLAHAAEEAAGVVRSAAAALPEVWDSEVATPVVGGYLLACANALDSSAGRARLLVGQARGHAEQCSEAAADVPKPAEFQAVQQQLQQASAANVNGRYTAVIAGLLTRKAQLETRAQQVYSAYRCATEVTTAGDGASSEHGKAAGAGKRDELRDLRGRVPTGGRGPGGMPLGFGPGGSGEPSGTGAGGGAVPAAAAAAVPPGIPGAGNPAGAGAGQPPGAAPAAAASAAAAGGPVAAGDLGAAGGPSAGGADGAMTPDKAGELAGMLPQMIPTVLGAAVGLIGGALSAVEKIPEALMQAGSQAAQAATQGLSGVVSPHMGGADLASGLDAPSADPTSGSRTGEVSGGHTTPAAGATNAAPVMPSTGPAAHIPPPPGGALPPPADAAGGASGIMPMGMPMGAMLPRGDGSGSGSDRPAKPKNLVVPPTAHTESVTGKVNEDRIARSAASSHREPGPPNDDDPPRPQGEDDPLRRLRIRHVTLRRDET